MNQPPPPAQAPPLAQPQYAQPLYAQQPQYLQPQYTQPQYTQQQYAQQQYTQPQYVQSQNVQPQNTQSQYAQPQAPVTAAPTQLTQPQPSGMQEGILHPLEYHHLSEVKDAIVKSGNTESLRKQGYYSSFESGTHSDCTIRSRDGLEWKVHKVIVTKNCKFFEIALGGGFRESRTNVVEMPNDEPAAVKALLEYLYVEDYSIVDSTPRTLGPLMRHLEVYIVGQIYDVPGLQDLAYRRFVSCWFTGRCPRNIFHIVARKVYDSTPESDNLIRGFLADMAAVHLRGLLLNKNFVEVMADFEAFSTDVAKSMAKSDDKHESKEFRCKLCEKALRSA
ncbi:hypothetical protein IWZ01DRAFT_559532 [Phyllosticta capitalensis]